MQTERRKAGRFELVTPSAFSLQRSAFSATPFHPGEQVKVRWTFAGQKQECLATAQVVWRREDKPAAGMGVRFIEVPPATEEALRRMDGAEGERICVN
ncbi:MAG: PilZ domain-containing protein [Deltaproteobacteria bacterium]|nr:PilZ domain-containing protein [Deltaproteobacteria bacterium]